MPAKTRGNCQRAQRDNKLRHRMFDVSKLELHDQTTDGKNNELLQIA
jgi:hypothetical protein